MDGSHWLKCIDEPLLELWPVVVFGIEHGVDGSNVEWKLRFERGATEACIEGGWNKLDDRLSHIYTYRKVIIHVHSVYQAFYSDEESQSDKPDESEELDEVDEPEETEESEETE